MTLNFDESGNVLIVPLEIKLGRLEKLQDAVKKLREAKKEYADVTDDKDDKAKKQDFDLEVEEKSKKEIIDITDSKTQMLDTIKDSLTPEGVTNIIQMSKNPMGLIMRLLSNPVTATIVASIGAGVIMHKLLTMRGGVFDLNFKRVVIAETIKGRALAEKEAIRVGIGRGVVITTNSGSTTPEYEFNSFEAVRTGQMKNIRAFQIRSGYRY